MRQLFAALVACLAGTLGAQVTFTATPNQAIPDNSPNGVTSTISIPATSNRIRSLRVGVRIAHTYDADLDIWLIPPGVAWAGPYTSINNGPVAEPPPGVIQLSTNNGGSGNNYGSTTATNTFASFSSSADPTWPATQSIVSGAAPFTSQSQWQPEWQGVWNTQYGKDPTGDWTLAVADGWALDTGTLLSWRIEYMPLTSPSLIVRTGDFNKAGTPAVPGQTGQVLGQAWIEAVGANAISGVTVTAQNGVTISGSLSQLAMYLDVNGDGALDGGDTFVQAATLAGSIATFNFGSSIPLTSGTTAALLLVGDVLASPAAGGVTLQITNAAAVSGATNVYGVFPVAFGFHPFASLRTFTSVPSGGKEIPNDQEFGVRDTITIPPTDDRIASVRIGVRFDHDRLQDVEMWLLPPGIDWSGPYTGAGPAGVIELSTDNGGNGDDFGTGGGPFVYTLFCSQSDPNLAWRANRNIQLGQSEAPFTYRPAYYPEDQTDFDALYGTDPSGQWTLVIADDNGQNSGGRLWSWQVEYLAHPKAALAGNPDHGNATVGLPSPSSPNTFTITNGGDYPLAVTGISFVGGNAADFSRSAVTLPLNVAAGGSSNFGVTFTPSASGVRNTTLRVTSNSGGVAGTIHDTIIWGFGQMTNQLVINPGFNNQPGTAFKFGTNNAVFGQYEFAAGTVAANVTSVTFREEANRVLVNNLANLRLYHDVDNNGLFSGADTLIGTTTLGPGQSSATFTVNRTINAQSFQNWILVGNVAALPVNNLLAFEVRTAADVVSTPSALAVYPVATGPHPIESTRIFTSTPPGGLAIPNNSTTGVTDSIVIPPTTETVAALRVGVRIDHPNDADIEMWLIPPGVTWNGPYTGNGPAGVILLSSDNGGTGDDYGSGTAPFVYANFTHQNDPRFTPSVNIAGQGTGAAPFTSTYYRPEDQGDFLARYGISPAGTWTLAVRDDAGNQFTAGILISWQIEYLPPATPAVTGLNDWGGSNVGVSSPFNPQPYSITNVGGTSLTVTAITLVGANANNWTFAGATGTPVTLNSGASHNVSLNFTPSALGVRNAFLRVTYNDGLQTGLIHDYPITGRGTRGLIGVATPVDYGSGGVGQPSANSPVTHTINNTGDGPLTLTAIALTGANPGDWMLSGLPALPVVIPAGGNIQFTGTLTPGAIGARNAIIRVTSNSNNVPATQTDIAVFGQGAAGTISVTTPVDYGSSNPGVPSSLSPRTHQVFNTGSSPLTITSISTAGTHGANWSLSGLPALPAVIPPSGSISFQGTLTPSAVGARNGIIRIISNTGGVPNSATDIVVTGTGTAGTLSTPLGPVNYGQSNPGVLSSLSPVTHTINNTGNGPLTLTAVTLLGANPGDWALLSAPGLPAVIPPSGSVNIQLRLIPTATGTRTATLRLTSDTGAAPGTFTNVVLTGVGTSGVLSTPAGPIDYGQSNPGAISSLSPRTHLITNTGNGPLTLTAIALTGANAGDWTILTSPALPAVIAPSAGVNIQARLTPTAVGARAATLRLTSDSGAVPGTFTDVSLTGLGTSGVPSTPLGPVDYGQSNVGVVSSLSPQTHTVNNTGDGPLTISAIALVGVDAGDWTIVAAPALPAIVAPSAAVNIQIEFRPGAVGARAATLRLTSDSGALPGTFTNVALEGTGTVGTIDTPPGPVNYGQANPGVVSNLSPLTHVVTNNGNGPLTVTAIALIGADASDWVVLAAPTLPAVIAPSANVAIDLQFTPGAVGLRSATLRLTSDTGAAPGTFTDVALSGEGTSGMLSTPLGPVDYGQANPGVLSSLSPVTHMVTNTGNGPLTLDTIALIGADAADWTIVGAPTLPAVIPPTGTVNVQLTHTPGAVGARTATLRLTSDSNAVANTNTDITLTGEGTQGVLDTPLGPVGYGQSNPGVISSLSPVTHVVANTGNGPLTLTAISLIGADAGDWTILAAPALPAVIAPSASVNIQARLIPGAVGTRSATLRLASDTGAVPGTFTDVALTGLGTSGVISTPLGPVNYGQSNPGVASSLSPQNHVVTNTGDGPLSLTAIALTGTDAGDWTILSAPALPAVIAPSASVNVQLQLVPSATGTRTATLRLTSDTGASPGTFTDVGLSGLGTSGVLSTPTGPISYGQSNPGTVTNLSPVVHMVTNTGDGPLTITAIALMGANPADWTILSAPALPVVIAPAGNAIVQLECTPLATGSRVVVLRFTSDSGAIANNNTNVALQATGTQGQLATAPGPIDYGSSQIGSPSSNSPLTHTISNTGNGPLTIFAISLQGADASDWSLIGAPGSYPVVIPVSGSLLFDGQLVPSADGPRNATLRIESDSLANPASVTNVPLEGLGLPLTTVTGVTVGSDIGGPLAVTATVNGPATTFIDVTVSYSGGINAGPPVISNAGGLTIAGNVIQNVPANSTIQFLWDAYATERHTTASDYVLTLTPSQASLAGTPGSSTPFTLQRNGGWAQHVAPGESPRGVYSHTMIYDTANDRAVVFGGRDTGNKLNTVWVLERSGAPYLGWRQLHPAGTPPAGRQYANAIYDAANQRMVLFGGLLDAGPTNDTWELTLTPGFETWNQIAISSPTTPSPRRSAGFVYDALRDRAVLFGGLGFAQSNDTWELNLSTGNWTELTPAGTPPSARFGHACALDAVGDRMIVFGGRAGSTDTGDLYELSLAGSGTWGQLAPTGSPSARYFSTHTWDGTNRALVVQSGYTGTVAQRDAWYLDLAGAPTWTQLTPDANAGTGRVVGGAVWDGSREEVLFYGGITNSALTSPIVSVLNVSGVPTWDTPTGGISTSPEGRWGGVMAWDHVSDRVIVWGGKDNSAYFGDVWVLDQSTPSGGWSRLPITGPRPEPRTYCGYAVDTVNDRLIIHGGGIPAGPVVDELWTLDLASGTWTQWPTAGGPTPRDQHTLVYDNLRNRALIFGGRVPGVTNEVWAYDFGTATWAQITPAAPLAPARHGHGASYDSINDRMVIFAGRAPTGRRNDVWTLSLNPGTETWTDASAVSPVPTPRHYFGFAPNSTGTRMWMHAGDTGTPSAELWELDMTAATAAWTQVAITGSAPLERYLGSACMSPAGQLYAGFGFLDNRGGADLWRIDTAATVNGWTQVGTSAPDSLVSATQAFDPVGRRLIAFGGLGGGVHQTGLWQLDLAAPVAQWTQLNANGPGPSARRSASMVYDNSTSPPRMLMFGGRTGFAHSSIVDELWALELNPGNEQWVQLTPTGTAGRRTNHAAVIDGSNRMIVYGGIDQNGGNLGTVFALDIATLTWSQLTPTGTAPSPRFSMIMEYDAPRNRIIIHGGNQGGVTPIGNSFVLDLTGSPSWSSYVTTGTGPGPLYYASSVIDAANQRMLVFGGHSTTPQSRLFGLDLVTDTWTEISGTVAQPQARWSHSACWDSVGNRMVIAGGYLLGEVAATQEGGSVAETWFWGD